MYVGSGLTISGATHSSFVLSQVDTGADQSSLSTGSLDSMFQGSLGSEGRCAENPGQ